MSCIRQDRREPYGKRTNINVMVLRQPARNARKKHLLFPYVVLPARLTLSRFVSIKPRKIWSLRFFMSKYLKFKNILIILLPPCPNYWHVVSKIILSPYLCRCCLNLYGRKESPCARHHIVITSRMQLAPIDRIHVERYQRSIGRFLLDW